MVIDEGPPALSNAEKLPSDELQFALSPSERGAAAPEKPQDDELNSQELAKKHDALVG